MRLLRGRMASCEYSDDVRGDYDCINARGAEFTRPLSAVPGSTIATLGDTCGNLIRLSQLK